MNSDTAVERKAYFEGLYARDEDPWRYDSCDYEIAKRADTLSFLRDHYRNACEVGCSIGVLTQTLAPRCTRIVGIDVSETAAALARQRLADQPNVEIRVLHLPHEDIDDRFDLLVLPKCSTSSTRRSCALWPIWRHGVSSRGEMWSSSATTARRRPASPAAGLRRVRGRRLRRRLRAGPRRTTAGLPCALVATALWGSLKRTFPRSTSFCRVSARTPARRIARTAISPRR